MLSQEEKLSRFLVAINEYAEEQRRSILNEAAQLKQKALAQVEKDVLEETKKLLQDNYAKIRVEIQTDFSRQELELRRKIIEKRTEITNNVFEQAKEKLVLFSKSDDYTKKLINDVKALGNRFSTYKSYTVFYVKPEDTELAGVITEAFDGGTVKADETIKIGGFRADNSVLGLIADATLDTGLDLQKDWFMENSGLYIS